MLDDNNYPTLTTCSPVKYFQDMGPQHTTALSLYFLKPIVLVRDHLSDTTSYQILSFFPKIQTKFSIFPLLMEELPLTKLPSNF